MIIKIIVELRFDSLSAKVIPGSLTITLSSIVPGAAKFTNFANIKPSFIFLKTSLLSGLLVIYFLSLLLVIISH